ncbi:hypothetical protein HDV02_001734 [Globomyces sp. JEL0801]|nr:hypothetical protein HDV02_001734 [Globomyces sp. JEL0801]
MPQHSLLDLKEITYLKSIYLSKFTDPSIRQSNIFLAISENNNENTNPDNHRKDTQNKEEPYKSLFAAVELGIEVASLHFPLSLDILSGGLFPDGTNPYSNHYGVGVYNILGEGRSINLGDILGKENQRYTLQLKGIGTTPYAKQNDGQVPLTTCLYEMFMTEALSQCRIPTYRSLSVVGSTSPCYRPNYELGIEVPYTSGVISRFSPSWIRFGTFELLYYRGDTKSLKALADFVIQEYYPDCIALENSEKLNSSQLLSADFYDKYQESLDGGILAPDKEIADKLKTAGKPLSIPLNRYAILLRRIIEKTATLIAHWQAAGFVHGLMNTENMSIVGVTLNVACGGFMDAYDPEWTPNRQMDPDGRYRFEMQPAMGQWALSRLGQTFVGLIGDSWVSSNIRPTTRPSTEQKDISTLKGPNIPSIPTQRKIPLGFLFNASKSENIIRELIREYETVFSNKFGDIICQKLGLKEFLPDDYDRLINPLLELMASTGVDYTTFFRTLCSFGCSETKYAQIVTYNPKGSHSIDNLKSSIPADSLGVLLKALLVLKEQDRIFVETEVQKLKDSGLAISDSISPRSPIPGDSNPPRSPIPGESLPPRSPIPGETLPPRSPVPGGERKMDLPIVNVESNDAATEPIEIEALAQKYGIEPLSLPSVDEVANSWKFWAHMYKSRLLNQIPVDKRTPETILEEDVRRQKRMKALNPKYALRGWILKEKLKEVSDQLAVVPDPSRKIVQHSKTQKVKKNTGLVM